MMNGSDRDSVDAEAAVRGATEALLAAEIRYQAVIGSPGRLSLVHPAQPHHAPPVDAAAVREAAAAYGAAAARLREAYQHARDVRKQRAYDRAAAS